MAHFALPGVPLDAPELGHDSAVGIRIAITHAES